MRKLLLLLLLWSPSGQSAPVLAPCPIKASANKRYLVDQTGQPFLMIGDSAWTLLCNLNLSNQNLYMSSRASNGFNTMMLSILPTTYIGGNGTALLDGTTPFTGTVTGGFWDLTTPKNAYFAELDTLLLCAATNGMQVMLNPCETGGCLVTQSIMQNNGSNSCYTYGQFIGNRYKGFTNILWQHGNDYDQINWSVATNDYCVMGLIKGIESVDANHMTTIELGSDAAWPDSYSDTNMTNLANLNAVYWYSQTYYSFNLAYNRSTLAPCFNTEQHYEEEAVGFPSSGTTNNQETGVPYVLRKQTYWTALAGGTGLLYGDHYTWGSLSGWQTHLLTPGVQQLNYHLQFMTNRAWYNLVPDTNNAFLTAGFGSYQTNGLISTNDHSISAITTDGTLGVVYIPTNTTVTVNMAALTNYCHVRWYDPTTNAYIETSGTPFANKSTMTFTTPGNNAAGDKDWVLLFEAITNYQVAKFE